MGMCSVKYVCNYVICNLSMAIIDSLKLIFPCVVFVGVSDRIQCNFFFGRENDGD